MLTEGLKITHASDNSRTRSNPKPVFWTHVVRPTLGGSKPTRRTRKLMCTTNNTRVKKRIFYFICYI